jgi:cell division protein FtsL
MADLKSINLLLLILLIVSFLYIVYLIHKHKQELVAAERKPENIPSIVQKYVDNNIGTVGLHDNVLGKHVALVSLIAVRNEGLCNQIMTLIQGIFTAIDNNQKIVIVDSFNNQIQKLSESISIPADDVFDFNAMNKLLEKYNVRVIDKTEVKYDIISASYGTLSSQVDITKEVLGTYTFNGVLFIPKHTHLNVLRGDPEPNNSKIFTLKYSVNGVVYEDLFTEKDGLESEICINVGALPFTYKFNWINAETKPRYNEFIKYVRFNKPFYDVAETYLVDMKDKPLNSIHIRNESDAIVHWSEKNNMTQEEFQRTIEAKYIELIKTNLSKEDTIFVLTYNTDSVIIKYLRENGYKFMMSEKNQEGREINAIIDLILGSKTTGTFIGTYNPVAMRGSSFSYVISQMMPASAKYMYIDLDFIQEPVKKLE